MQLMETDAVSRRQPEGGMQPAAVVAIPVRNEREKIVRCLEALTGQSGVTLQSFGVLLFLNNCTDDTRALIERWLPACPLAVRIVETSHDAPSAGWARKRAMEEAAAWIDEKVSNPLLLTTDADSRVPPDWLARNRAAIEAGADAVAGRIAFDPIDVAALPPILKRRQSLEAEYESLLIEIEGRLAPQDGNPWPYHWMKSGASIAVRLDVYNEVGGMPLLPCGEDQAFVDLLRARRFVVRQTDDIVVTTSGRLLGRAKGGTADTLREWCRNPDSPCEPRLQRLGTFIQRMLWGRTFFIRRWERPLRPSDLPRQIKRARLLLQLLRLREKRLGKNDGAPLTSDGRAQPSTP